MDTSLVGRIGNSTPAGFGSRHDQSRLAAVLRLAFEAADSGLLTPELAAGIGRVKGVKQLGSGLEIG